jgi:hypothetical protein
LSLQILALTASGYLLREAAIYHSHQFDSHRGTNPLSFTLEVNMVRITKQGCFFGGNKISLKVKHKTVIVDKQKTRVSNQKSI